jgi:Glyoxalase-like domain
LLSRRSFIYASGGAVAASLALHSQETRAVPPELDHLILGARDLDEGIDYLEKLSGYRAAYGGSHPGRGTRNALLKLGHHSYLEILAPDPDQSTLVWHKELPTLDEPRLVGWAEQVNDIGSLAAHLRKRGVKVIGPTPGSRTRPNGETLRWTLLLRSDDRGGILPFYIEWDSTSPHPSDDAPGGCLLVDLHRAGQLIETPPPKPGLHVRQDPSKPAQLRATIAGQIGEFVLVTKSVPTEHWSQLELP